MLGSCVKAVAVGKVDGNEAAGGKKINEKKSVVVPAEAESMP